MVKIYTKTGDKGETSLFGGKRVSKADLRVEAYGCVDELTSLIGVIISQYQKSKIKNELSNIQNDLFEISSVLASPNTKYYIQNTKYLESRVGDFELLIDKLSKDLPELKNFILPGGGEAGSLLHFARTVCRRAERRIVELSQKENVPENIIAYFNRLSDLLFVMARYINYKEKKKEVIWHKV